MFRWQIFYTKILNLFNFYIVKPHFCALLDRDGVIFLWICLGFAQKRQDYFLYWGSLWFDPMSGLSLDNWKPRGSLEILSIGVRSVGSLWSPRSYEVEAYKGRFRTWQRHPLPRTCVRRTCVRFLELWIFHVFSFPSWPNHYTMLGVKWQRTNHRPRQVSKANLHNFFTNKKTELVFGVSLG